LVAAITREREKRVASATRCELAVLEHAQSLAGSSGALADLNRETAFVARIFEIADLFA